MTISKIQQLSRQWGLWVLVIFHAVGIGLLSGPWRHDLVVLTPLNLALLSALYLLASDPIERPLLYFAPIALGFGVEVLGTNTGVPFGEYAYSNYLGPRLWATPLTIGLLWWVLLRSWFDWFGRWTQHRTLRSLLTGLGMVLMDFFIEPVAIELNFWRWNETVVPVENYVAWFVLSAVFAWLTAKGHVSNALSKGTLGVLLAFFLVLTATYHWFT